jgi:hypothetical protein
LENYRKQKGKEIKWHRGRKQGDREKTEEKGKGGKKKKGGRRANCIRGGNESE